MAFVDWLLETESRDRESVKDIVANEGGSLKILKILKEEEW